MIAVTGAAGFIGSAFLWKLNAEGQTDILAVDERNILDREKNLSNKKFSEYMDKDEFLTRARMNSLPDRLNAIVHIGACSSTTETDAEFLWRNNTDYTRVLAEWCLAHRARFLYASSAATYGEGEEGYDDSDENTRRLKPLNLYGKSKQDFDLLALDKGWLHTIAGFKFFNVYGPNEYHKGDMRSIIAKSFDAVVKERKIRLFKSYRPAYPDGGQKRDFVYVKDAVDAVWYFLEHPDKNGLFNIGTGQARTWNDLAAALFTALGIPLNIEYIEMPHTLRDKYQYFTEAKLDKLMSAGYVRPFTPLEAGVKDYCGYLQNKNVL
ncbi:MAG: ADP-glyceromanno-heptose 6-epimerase [Fibrobacterota bacterium]